MNVKKFRNLIQDYFQEKLDKDTIHSNIVTNFLTHIETILEKNKSFEDVTQEASYKARVYEHGYMFVPQYLGFGDIVYIKGLKHYAVIVGERLDQHIGIVLTSKDDVLSIPINTRMFDREGFFSYTMCTIPKTALVENPKIVFSGVYNNDSHLIDVAKEVFNFYSTKF